MKTKLEMAHEYALEMLKRGDPEWRIVTDAWNLADTMYLENAELENIVCQDLSQEDWQPDWSQAPEWAKWWVMTSKGVPIWIDSEPKISDNDFYWCLPRGNIEAPSFNYQGDWKESLRERS